jgi:hypothetical protein
MHFLQSLLLATMLAVPDATAFTSQPQPQPQRRGALSLDAKKGTQNDELPANLKRKVSARRNPLGHVVPIDTRTKGCK